MKFISVNNGLRLLFYSSILAAFPCTALARAHASPNGAAYFQQTISGTVSDGSGPLPGVTVLVKGTRRSVVTDTDGKFSIVASPSEVLIFSFIGYKDVEVIVGNQNTLNIILEDAASNLEELTINAGYYTVTKRESTGNISRVTAKDIGKQPLSNPLAALQGRMPGVNITQASGVPGSNFNIQIRGTNSLRADGNTPLYVVDGIPFGGESLGSSLASGGILPGTGLSPLNSINPADIQSIEILKDADATSIYGSRGANGVVLITTKKAKEGKSSFTINSYTGAGTITRKMDLMNTSQYLAMREQALANDGITELPFYAYDVNGTWDRNRYTDWQKELIGGTSTINSTQIGVSGGNRQTRYLVNATHYKETTVFPGDFSYNKTTVNFNVGHTSEDNKFEIALSGNYTADKNNLAGNDLTRQAYTLAPNAPALYLQDGSLNWEGSTWTNPLSVLRERYLALNNNLIANGSITYRPLKGLEIRANLGYTDARLQESRKSPSSMYDPAYGFGSEVSTLFQNTASSKSWNFEPQISYESSLFGGTLKALLGTTFQSRSRIQSSVYGTGFLSDELISNIAAASIVTVMPSNNSEYRYNAAFARLNYSYNGTYFLNLTGRRDGSSRFGPGKRFANFGAIGAAWVFRQNSAPENFLPWLSFGKLRASYGTTGSDMIGDYQFLNTYLLSQYQYQGSIGLEPSRLFNPAFSWETNKKAEAAIDLGLFKDRFTLSVAHYRNRSSNQLVGIPLPGTTGFSSISANLGATVENTGWEFELGGKPFTGNDFNWNVSLNLTIPNNKLIAFPGLEGSTYAQQYIIGQAVDIRKVYHYTGINPQTGVYEFEDYDGDGNITANGDREKTVRVTPTIFGGLQNSLSYKNWQIDFLFQFAKQKGSNYNYLGTLPGTASNLPAEFTNVWQQPGDTGVAQPYTTGSNADRTQAFYRFMASDAAYSDASYIRLKNLSISYTIPQKWLGGMNCRVYTQGQNLLTITNFKGPDPENQSTGLLPPLRVVSIGAEINF